MERDGILIGPVESRAVIPMPGLIWRTVRFRPMLADHLDYADDDGTLRIDLPPDLRPAVGKRQSEYLAGRLCAALALRDIGVAGQVGRAGRAPVWPAGTSGSITHSAGRAIAVVSDRIKAVGLDCEPLMSAQTLADVADMVMTSTERAHQPETYSRAQFCTLVFSAKEAVYKALSPGLTDIPDFSEAQITRIESDSLWIAFRGADVGVRFVWDEGDCVTLAIPELTR